MLFMGLVSPDQALSHAISEQVKRLGSWQLALFASPQEALAVWTEILPPLVFWDAEETSPQDVQAFGRRLAEAEDAPWLIVLGDLPKEGFLPEVSEHLARPLRLGSLLARMQFYQRLLEQPPDRTLALGGWAYHPRTRSLRAPTGDETVRLTDKEAALLDTLLLADASVRREKLLEDVWGYNDQVDTHTLETHIYRLRRKLMVLDPSGPDCFVAEQGGYAVHPAWRSAS